MRPQTLAILRAVPARVVVGIVTVVSALVMQSTSWVVHPPDVLESGFAVVMALAALLLVVRPAWGDWAVVGVELLALIFPQYTPADLAYIIMMAQCTYGAYRKNYLPTLANGILGGLTVFWAASHLLALQFWLTNLVCACAGWSARRTVEELDRARTQTARAVLETQRTIAGDIHDSTTRELTRLVMSTRLLRYACQKEHRGATTEELAQLESEALKVVNDTRTLIRTLETELESAHNGTTRGGEDFYALLEKWGAARALRIDARWQIVRNLPVKISVLVNRVATEILANAEKYALPGSTVSIHVREAEGKIVIESTNRLDFNNSSPSGFSGGTGLARIQRRLEAHGGTLQAGEKDRLWQVKASIPLTGKELNHD